MEPNKFRTARESINTLCDSMDSLIQKKVVDETKKILKKAVNKLADLVPQAEGTIQNRSVKNLDFKLKHFSLRIDKIKLPKRKTKAKARKPKEPDLIWDKEKIESLKLNFIKKALINMASDNSSVIRFGTTGKGIRPNYQITFSNGDTLVFNGSSHKSVQRKASFDKKKVSDPFDYELIEKIVEKGTNKKK